VVEIYRVTLSDGWLMVVVGLSFFLRCGRIVGGTKVPAVSIKKTRLDDSFFRAGSLRNRRNPGRKTLVIVDFEG